MITGSNNADVKTSTDIQSGDQIYKHKLWYRLLSLFSLSFSGLVLGIPLILLIATMVDLFRDESQTSFLPTVALVIFAPTILLCAFAVIQLAVSVIASFFSYIKTTPEGIENKIWPFRNIRARWTEVDRLGQFFLSDVVYLKSFEVLGFSLSFVWPFKFLNPFQTNIALSYYKGWPDGELAADLKTYAPHLFAPRPAAGHPLAIEPGISANELSQENRLLAAVSHASVLFTGMGFAVPLVIYLTQKKKSTYLSFHALQAFIYQLAGTLFYLLLPFCFILMIFVPAFGSSVAQTNNSADPWMMASLVLTIGLSVLFAFVGMAYVIYGIVAAVLTYQGKNFRYILIGKRIPKPDLSARP